MLVPKDVEKTMVELGFSILSIASLYDVWSVVGLKGDKRYNVQLNKNDLSIASIYLLRYKFNQWGSRIVDVERALIQSGKAEKVRVI